jgi:NADPH:quinone reductase-like Zn-dependent oxidoreductase
MRSTNLKDYSSNDRKEKARRRETTMQNSSGIEDQVVVTGASSGIGEATALLLAERGAKVVLGARGSDRLAALAARIADAGGKASYAPAGYETARRWLENRAYSRLEYRSSITLAN